MSWRFGLTFLALCTVVVWSGCGGGGNDGALLSPGQTGAQIDLTQALAVPFPANPVPGSSANVTRLSGLQDPGNLPNTVAELTAELNFWVNAAQTNPDDSAAQLGLSLLIVTCASHNALDALGGSPFGTTSVKQIVELGMSQELRPQRLMSDAMAAMTSARVPPPRATEAGDSASQSPGELRWLRRVLHSRLLSPLANAQQRLIRIANGAPRTRRLVRLMTGGPPITLYSADYRALGATLGLVRCALLMVTAIDPDYDGYDWNLYLVERDANQDGRLTVAEYAPPPPFGEITEAKWTRAGSALRGAVNDMARALTELTPNDAQLLQLLLAEARDPTQFQANISDAAAMLNGRVQVTVFYDRVVSSADDAPATDEVEAVTRVPFNLREIWDTPPASLLDLLPPLHLSLGYGMYQTGGTDLFGMSRGRVRPQNARYHVWRPSPYASETGTIATGPAPHRFQVAPAGDFPGIDGRFNWNWTRFRGAWGGSTVTATCADPSISGIFKWGELPDPTLSGAFPNTTKMKALIYGDYSRMVLRYRSLVVRSG